MTRTAVPLIALFALAPLATSAAAERAPFGPPPGAELVVEKLAPIEPFVNGEIAAGKIPGAIVLVQQHGKPVYLTWFGVRDPDKGTPMTENAIFPIHSLTKTITSLAAMTLIDRGKIALADPVSKYIPSFAEMKVGFERKDDSGKTVLDLLPLRRPITVEDLLLHTSEIGRAHV